MGKNQKKGKVTKNSKKKSKNVNSSKKTNKKNKSLTIVAPSSKKDRLIDLNLSRSHNFLSSTKDTLTEIYKMRDIGGQEYEIRKKPSGYSTILKLSLKTQQTDDLPNDWSLILWNITQNDRLDKDVLITSVRAFEKKDNDLAKAAIKRRRRTAIFSSESAENKKKQGASLNHDWQLLNAIDSGEGVVSFGAEMIISAPTEKKLEEAVTIVSDYLKADNNTNGLEWSLDINRQAQPFITYGPNVSVGNREVFYEMTSEDAARSALFVDSGGDRTPGAEYVGVSVGKLIRSHAAYNFLNSKSLFIGNDATDKTSTLGGEFDVPSQIYLSNIASRAYLLNGKNVVHFVVDKSKHVDILKNFPIYDERKAIVDVSKGYLNIMEPIKPKGFNVNDPRIVSYFDTHIKNLITLFSQFRDVGKHSNTDEFTHKAYEVLIDFYIENRVWRTDSLNNVEDLRLFGRHGGFETLDAFVQYISRALASDKDAKYKDALYELNTIIRNRILTPIPALNVKTDDIIDKLVDSKYKVVDLTSMSIGHISGMNNPSLNIMALAYLNIILPSLDVGDVIMFHGISRMSGIASVLFDIVQSSGKNIDLIFTESNQTYANTFLDINDSLIDFAMVDLYNNRVDKLVEEFGMDSNWVKQLKQIDGSFFVRTDSSIDYIYLDSVF